MTRRLHDGVRPNRTIPRAYLARCRRFTLASVVVFVVLLAPGTIALLIPIPVPGLVTSSD